MAPDGKLMIARILLPFLGLAACVSAQPRCGQARFMFGSSKRTAGALIGILYDFKQDQKRQKTPLDNKSFERAVAEFVDSGYDEGLLNKYYRVPRALYTTQLQNPHDQRGLRTKGLRRGENRRA